MTNSFPKQNQEILFLPVVRSPGLCELQKQLLLIKSTNHFHAGFAPIAREVLYARVEGPYPDDPRKTEYRKLVRRVWPRDDVFAD